jgi:hypothetical protein
MFGFRKPIKEIPWKLAPLVLGFLGKNLLKES